MGEDQALGLLQDILAHPEYRVDRSVPWWQQILAALFDVVWSVLLGVFQTIGDTASGREGVFGWAVLGLCVVLFAAVLVYLVRAVRLSVLHESRLERSSLAERRERSDQLWRTAQQLAAAGRLAEAVRLVYLSALYALDERALLHVESSLTNREHARRLSQLHPVLGDSFSDVVEHYDRLRYGSLTVGLDTYSELNQRVQRVRAAAFEGTAA
jgi:Domain of unknown function (DUF4129)